MFFSKRSNAHFLSPSGNVVKISTVKFASFGSSTAIVFLPDSEEEEGGGRCAG